jgi:hypothetical protein
LKNITLEESFIGVKPEIEHFNIFGCPMYFHVPKEEIQARPFREQEYICGIQ